MSIAAINSHVAQSCFDITLSIDNDIAYCGQLRAECKKLLARSMNIKICIFIDISLQNIYLFIVLIRFRCLIT